MGFAVRGCEGAFITLEGGDGVGKSTQAQLLAAHFTALGRKVLLTREPGGCRSAEAMRAVFLDHALNPLSELFMLLAARREHIVHTIAPALAQGMMVICDRYIDSTRVYQALRGVDSATIEQALQWTCGDCWPHYTVVYQLDETQQRQRLMQRNDNNRFDAAGADFHAAVQQKFAAIAAADPARCILQTTQHNPRVVLEQTLQQIQQRVVILQ